jgi:hypothetical protein
MASAAKFTGWQKRMDSFEGLAMARVRSRVKHKQTFKERLAEEARRFKEAAETEPPGSMSGNCSCAGRDKRK